MITRKIQHNSLFRLGLFCILVSQKRTIFNGLIYIFIFQFQKTNVFVVNILAYMCIFLFFQKKITEQKSFLRLCMFVKCMYMCLFYL